MNNKMTRHLLQRLPFPLTMGLGLLAGHHAVSVGLAPASLPVAATLVGLLLSLALERTIPRVARPAEPGELRTDLSWLALTGAVSSPLLDGLVLAIAVAALTLMPTGLLADLPLWAGVLVAALVSSFGDYWAHRWGHERWWRLHAVHHAPRRMVTLNNLRLHPVDLLLKRLAGALPLLLLGLSPEAVALFGVVLGINTAFQHSDADLRHGWLNHIFNTNSLHRWHHSAVPREANTNYGAPLVIWDQLLGTFHLPGEGEEPGKMGLFKEEHYPIHSLLRATVAPLCWRQCVQEPDARGPRTHE